MSQLKVRKPTGRVPWPLILIEGGEKSGKSWACAQFSTSKRIGQMYWIDLGEGAADEYGAIPDANYLVVEHDGTWAQIQGAVDAVKAEAARAAQAGEPPVVLVIDSMTAEWDLLKDWASDKARRRHEGKVRNSGGRVKPLAADEEPKISMDLWNEAGARHRKLMTTLMTFPGIVLLTARGKDVAALDDKGAPISGTKDYRVEGHKTLGFDVSCWIRLDRAKPGTVIGVRSVHVGIRPGYDDPIELARDWTVENIVFETLRCAPAEAHTRDLVALQPAEPDAPERPVSAPPASRPASGPPAALSAAATGLLGHLAQAADETGLHRVWNAASDAGREGRITATELTHFRAQWKVRKAELFPPEPKNPGNDPQRRKMFALLGQADMSERDYYLPYVCDVIKREVGSTNDLTDDEVQAVNARLESYIAQQTPPAEEMGAAS